MDKALNYAQTHAEAFRQQLRDLLRIPSVSTDRARAGAVHEAAAWFADNMRRAGIENVEIMPTDGHSVVYGDWLHAGQNAPTLLVYGHYDVQPADKADGWENDPFIPYERDGKLYARGASDDKGQVFAHVKAVEAVLVAEGGLPINVKFMVEGEEEIGSPNLLPFLEQHQQQLSADVCVISDSDILAEDQPSIVYALRGLVAAELEVRGPSHDLHSGLFGGVVHNPLQALAEIIARLHNDDGSVAVPGFYDDVVILEEEERDELKKTDWTAEEIRRITGVPAPWGEAGYSLRERVGARPTLEINGIMGGYYGDGMKTVLPAKAIAKISCRLVSNQNAARIFEQLRDYIAEITPPTVYSEVRKITGQSEPALLELDSPAMQAAMAAYEKGWGKPPVFMREGGTLPVVAYLQRTLKLPVVLMGFGLSTDGAHGPNEHFTISMFHKGIDTLIHLFYETAERL